MELDRAEATYDIALRRVMADLMSTTELRPDVAVDFTDPGELHYWYHSEGGGSHGASLGSDDDEESATVRLADLIQDDALDDLWGPAWPICPGHSHPAHPTLHDDRATWVCPRSRQTLAIIGNLAP
jgi:hypothetical protein